MQLHHRLTTDDAAESNFSFRFLSSLSELVDAVVQAGQIAEALALIEAVLEQSDGSWFTPEWLRLKGENFLLQSSSLVSQTAEDHFRQVLEWARCFVLGTPRCYEPRPPAARPGRIGEARDLLASIYERFTERFGTADLQSAKRQLDEFA